MSFRQNYFQESQSPINSAVLVPKRAALLTTCGMGISLIWVAAKWEFFIPSLLDPGYLKSIATCHVGSNKY